MFGVPVLTSHQITDYNLEFKPKQPLFIHVLLQVRICVTATEMKLEHIAPRIPSKMMPLLFS